MRVGIHAVHVTGRVADKVQPMRKHMVRDAERHELPVAVYVGQVEPAIRAELVHQRLSQPRSVHRVEGFALPLHNPRNSRREVARALQ